MKRGLDKEKSSNNEEEFDQDSEEGSKGKTANNRSGENLKETLSCEKPSFSLKKDGFSNEKALLIKA